MFLLALWLFNVYNTAGVFTERKITAVELYSVNMIKKSANGVEWVMNADKLVKDDNFNKHYFTNIDFTTDPASDGVQLISAKEAIHDGNLKVMGFSGNVHIRSVYPDSAETELERRNATESVSNVTLDTMPVTFFDRGRPKKYLVDHFYTDAMEYYYEHKILIARTPIKAVRPKMEITGDSLEHKVKEKRGKVVGNVKIKIFDPEEI